MAYKQIKNKISHSLAKMKETVDGIMKNKVSMV